MISQKTIRSEGYAGTMTVLRQYLRDIPMTSDQRERVADYLDELEQTFNEANG